MGTFPLKRLNSANNVRFLPVTATYLSLISSAPMCSLSEIWGGGCMCPRASSHLWRVCTIAIIGSHNLYSKQYHIQSGHLSTHHIPWEIPKGQLTLWRGRTIMMHLFSTFRVIQVEITRKHCWPSTVARQAQVAGAFMLNSTGCS